MQSYTEIASTETLANSLSLLLNNFKTAISSSSGTAFPTANLQVGMPCFRTDQNKLYLLKDATPTWYLLLDLSGASALIATATSATTATNLASGAAGQIPYQTGAGVTGFSAAGTSGQVLTSGGAGAPTWTSQSSLSVGTAASCSGNAATATTLQTTRSIGDVSFNGSADIVPQRIDSKDTRSTDFAPYTYKGISLHLKTNTTDSLADGGTYHALLNLQPWSDSSGGKNHQLGFTDNGNINYRINNADNVTWGAWQTLIDTTNYNSYSPTLTGGGASGSWSISVTGSSASCTGNAATATSATTATHVAGGVAGAVHYQSAANTTGFSAAGTSGQVLTSAGTSAPTWTSQSSLSVGSATTATHVAGGVAGAVHYQSAAGATGFSAAGTSGQVLTSGGTGAPTWTSQSSLSVGTASSCSGNAATATTASGLASANNYQVNSLGVGTAGSAVAGEIRATGNITAYYASDSRFKENVQNISDALTKVLSIGGKSFDWTDEYISSHGGADGYFVSKSDFGVIAQDVQSVFPIAVKQRGDGTLVVDYAKLCALAFQAIVELTARIEAIEAEV